MDFIVLTLLQVIKFFTYRVAKWGYFADLWVDKKLYRRLNTIKDFETATEWQDDIWETLEDEERADLDPKRHEQDLRHEEWVEGKI